MIFGSTMKGAAFAWPMALAFTLIQAPCPAQAQDFAQIDRDFVCPEALKTDQERDDALKGFVEAMAKAAPQDTVPQVLFYRRQLLIKHGCAQTLHNLETAEQAIRDGAVLEQPWLTFGKGEDYIAAIAAANIKPYSDPRYPTEKAVEIYVKLGFFTPQQAGPDHVDFDQVVSHNLYYCESRRYALVQRDYFLAGKEVFKDQGAATTIEGVNTYELKSVPPGSINEAAYEQSCGTVSGEIAT